MTLGGVLFGRRRNIGRCPAFFVLLFIRGVGAMRFFLDVQVACNGSASGQCGDRAVAFVDITTEEAAVIGDDDSGAIAEGVASVLGRLCGVERCEINSNKCVSDGDADLNPNADTQLVGD